MEVFIGTARCNVTSLSRNQLTCRPPRVQPAARGASPGDTPQVVVVVGGNLRFVIGKLSYESLNSGEGQLPKSVIIGVTIGNCEINYIQLYYSNLGHQVELAQVFQFTIIHVGYYFMYSLLNIVFKSI